MIEETTYLICFVDPKTNEFHIKEYMSLTHAINFVSYLMIMKTPFTVSLKEDI